MYVYSAGSAGGTIFRLCEYSRWGVKEPLHVMNTTGKDVFDVAYTNDDLNRLTAADQGHWTGSAVSDYTDSETWSLTQTGNWASYFRDTDASGTVSTAVATDAVTLDEMDDTRTPASNFNGANEFTGSVTRTVGLVGGGTTTQTVNYGSAYNAVGAMVDDMFTYKYTYDAFGRLVTVKNQSNALVSEYKYNGLGYKIGWHYDTDSDGTVENNTDDPWYWTTYNERWQEVATFNAGDSSPKQRVVHNQAGLAGRGGASYIDGVILTDTHSGAWKDASSGTLATRRYMLQNWRADVVATTKDNGDPYEYIRYSPYGIPTSYPAADANRNGKTNATDSTDMSTVFSGGSAPIVIGIDTNKDGLYPDTADIDYMNDEAADTTKFGGYNKVGTATGTIAPSPRFAYAGYAWDPAIKMYHVRHRVYNPEMGRWLTRDPAGYAEDASLVLYAYSRPLSFADPEGLIPVACRHSSSDDCCKTACAANPTAKAATVCSGTTAACCICDDTVNQFDSRTIRDAIVRCASRHESVHVGDIDCSRNQGCTHPSSPGGLPWNPLPGGACSECRAYGEELLCLASVMCPITDFQCRHDLEHLTRSAELLRDRWCRRCSGR